MRTPNTAATKKRRDRQRQADVLIELAKGAELFHVPDGTGYADLEVNGHRETWLIRSKGNRGRFRGGKGVLTEA